MAVLRSVRDVGRGARLTDRSGLGLRPGLILLTLLGLVAACERPDPRLRPEQLLRDSLGLGDDDRVHRVRLVSEGNRESPDPASLVIRPGDYVQFVSGDHRVHVVSFPPGGLAPPAAEFLRTTGQLSSPPLLVADARFVVTFADAPPGLYPFLVVGNGTQAPGTIEVGEAKR